MVGEAIYVNSLHTSHAFAVDPTQRIGKQFDFSIAMRIGVGTFIPEHDLNLNRSWRIGK